ncbi:uncharacterized protein LOC142985934 [Anticarsia gemmatalis]|uniref:uncharacterized protein LOC142985934 n=1 Tax=Anticarsia gemmatalis TaxID=129554 RepID=UPI003F765317
MLIDDAETALTDREDFDRQFFSLVALTRSLLGSSVNVVGSEAGFKDADSALVNVISHTGKKYAARLLLDNGSTANFVTHSLTEKLGLTLADPNFNVPSAVDVLVGAEVFWNVIGSNTIDLGKNLPKLLKAQNVQPVMGQLPSSRTNFEFPFLHSYVDYAGPVLIANRAGRGCKLTKAYMCIFVCSAVKAVHLELVTDLTSEAYMAALNRFVARRGKPRSITSDNGTNFVGASNEMYNFLNSSNVPFEIAQEGIEFIFTPAYSPHFNSLAEAAVKSCKHHLKRLLGLTHFTYEEMSTCLIQIEAVLNSRPLTPLSSDPNDFTALTPSHFLIGRPLLSVPCTQVTDNTHITRLDRWKRIQYIRQHFWGRFHNEYTSLLQAKSKWFVSRGEVKPGTLVLIKDKTTPPLLWSLGRVTKTYPGVDGVTRVAEMKTRRGTIRRAFNCICPLPLED